MLFTLILLLRAQMHSQSKMEHFAQTISPSVHLEEQTVIASAIIPMKHFQACEEICSCQSGVEQEAGLERDIQVLE